MMNAALQNSSCCFGLATPLGKGDCAQAMVFFTFRPKFPGAYPPSRRTWNQNKVVLFSAAARPAPRQPNKARESVPAQTQFGLRRPDSDASWRGSNYLSSTVAPASSSFFLIASASSFVQPSLMAFGAASTRSLASFSPRPVMARTSLITLIFFSP